MANGTIHKLGTLYMGNTKIARPTKPWRRTGEPYSGAGPGNIDAYTSGATLEIRNTDSADEYKMQWVEVNEGNKKYLVCDRVMLVNISRNQLGAQNLIQGKNIVIDGITYKIRILTGGSAPRNPDDQYAGGSPSSNEWDKWIVNEARLSGLPIPTASDLNTTLNSTDLNGAHNRVWNWVGVYSLAEESIDTHGAIRSYYSPRMWGMENQGTSRPDLGWRPVLEVLNDPPTLTLTSPADNQTLVEGNIYEISGTASETDVGNVVTVKYKIDDGQTYNITAGVSDGTTPINFNKSLTYLNNRLYDGQTPVTPILDDQVPHTLKVWAEDDQGGKSTEETRNFTVLYNQPPQISGQDEDLGTITEPPSIQYSVTDIEGYAFTIKEAVDGNTIRTFPGVDGQQETVTIPQDMWIRLQPGVTHSLTITATDQYGATSTRTFTFIRTVDGIELMTTTILPADEQPSRVILSLNGSIPSNANLNIQVCNNAHDPSPTWEDMTDSVKNKRPYVFTNTTSTTGQWGIQFKISIMPGA